MLLCRSDVASMRALAAQISRGSLAPRAPQKGRQTSAQSYHRVQRSCTTLPNPTGGARLQRTRTPRRRQKRKLPSRAKLQKRANGAVRPSAGSRARAKPRSLYDEQAEELRKKGVELQTQDDDEENEEQDDDRSATFVAEPTQKKARARTGAVAAADERGSPSRPRPSSRPSPLPNKEEKSDDPKRRRGLGRRVRDLAREGRRPINALRLRVLRRRRREGHRGDSLDEDADDAAWTQLLTALGDQLGSKATPRARTRSTRRPGGGDAFEERFRGAWAEVVGASARGDRGAYEETAIS